MMSESLFMTLKWLVITKISCLTHLRLVEGWVIYAVCLIGLQTQLFSKQSDYIKAFQKQPVWGDFNPTVRNLRGFSLHQKTMALFLAFSMVTHFVLE